MIHKSDQKVRIFVAEYLIDGNGTRAASVAGWSEKSAHVTASRLLKNPKVQALLEAGRKKIEAKAGVTVEGIVDDLREIQARCMQRVPVMVFDKVNKVMVQATEEVVDDETGETREADVWEFDSSGAVRATELIGKTIGAFKESGELTLKQPEPIRFVPFPKKGKRA